MVTQLIEKERIRTTLAKAKNLQRYADHIITLGKQVRRGRCTQGHQGHQGHQPTKKPVLYPMWNDCMDTHILHGPNGGLADAATGLRTAVHVVC